MSSIQECYNETFKTKRIQKTTGNIKEAAVYLEGVSGFVYPIDEHKSQDIEGSFGKDLGLMCEEVDIREGDLVVRTESGADVDYRVVGKIVFPDFIGKDGHLELKIRAFKK